MQSQRAFTLLEMAVVLSILLVIASLSHTCFQTTREIGVRTLCATNLKDIHTAMYTYSVMHKDLFPMAGAADPNGSATGFREGSRRPDGAAAVLDNNVTANIWMMIREGAISPKRAVCPNSGDVVDPLTVSIASSEPVSLKDTRDFLERRNLSYSTINMYHVTTSRFWSSTVPPDYIIFGDNNATDHPQRHTLSKAAGASITNIAARENSPNHGTEGQNLQWGDGHVAFVNDPFQGPGEDNAYAMIRDGIDQPPTLGNSDGDAAAAESSLIGRDSWLLPLSGNGGVSLSGLKNDVVARRDSTRSVPVETIAVMVVLAGVVTVALFMLWARRHEQPQG